MILSEIDFLASIDRLDAHFLFWPAGTPLSCCTAIFLYLQIAVHLMRVMLSTRNLVSDWETWENNDSLNFGLGQFIFLLCGGKTWNAATARSNMRSKSRPKKWRRLQASPATCIKRPPSLQSQYPTKQWVSSMQFVSKNQLAAWFWWFRGMIDRQTHTQMMKAPWELQLYCRFQELLTTTHVPLALSILYPLHSASNAGPSRA